MFSIGSEIRNYSLLYVLGEGAHAVVWCALHKIIKKKVAIKIVHNEEKQKSDMREIEILKSIEFKHIVEVFEWFEDENNLFIVMEYLPNGSLQHMVRSAGSIKEIVAKKYIYQLLLTIDFLHQKQIMHRDIKAENILLDANNDIRLIDFGLSEGFNKLEKICGSPAYMAPEMILDGHYDERADLWSIGILLFYLIVGRFPFYEDSYQKLFYKTLNTEFLFPDNISKEAKDLLSRLLEKNPDNRISVRDALNHPWLTRSSAIVFYKSVGNVLAQERRSLDINSSPIDEVSAKIMSNQSKLCIPLNLNGITKPKSFSVGKGIQLKRSTARKGTVNVRLICPELKKSSIDFSRK